MLLLVQIGLVSFFIWRASGRIALPVYHILIWFAALYIFEFEFYLEVKRFLGFVVILDNLRIVIIRIESFVLGMFLNEIIYYAENYLTKT